MRYDDPRMLAHACAAVGAGGQVAQSQESLSEQIKDAQVLATRFGLYDAADWLKELIGHRERYHGDYGEEPPAA